MGRKKKLAADGTPLAREPKQDANGNWYCQSCGRASGFKSKMAVLGHMRVCRPGRPDLGDLLGPLSALSLAAPIAAGASPAGADPNVAALAAAMTEFKASFDKFAFNHAAHVGGVPKEESSLDVATILKWGGVALLAILIWREVFPARGSGSLGSAPTGERRSSLLDGLKDGLAKKLTANVSSRIAKELLPE